MVGASTIVERTRKTSNLKIEARFVNIPESPKFIYGEYVKPHKIG